MVPFHNRITSWLSPPPGQPSTSVIRLILFYEHDSRVTNSSRRTLFEVAKLKWSLVSWQSVSAQRHSRTVRCSGTSGRHHGGTVVPSGLCPHATVRRFGVCVLSYSIIVVWLKWLLVAPLVPLRSRSSIDPRPASAFPIGRTRTPRHRHPVRVAKLPSSLHLSIECSS